MATWHPPIPAEAVYQPEVAELGAGIRLFLFCYNCVERDGTFALSLKDATTALGVKYETLRKWWQGLRESGIVTVLSDRGRSGFHVQFNDGWIDWHVHEKNFSTQIERENKDVENRLREGERSNFTAENAEPSLNGPSIDFQRENTTVEGPAYKVLMSDQESKRESDQHDRPDASLSLARGQSEKRTHPAVALYRTAWPDIRLTSKQEAIIRDVVGDRAGHLECWREVIRDYELSPQWKPENLGNLRERFDRKLAEHANKAPNGGAAKPVDNRPPLPAFQPQQRVPTNGVRLRELTEEVMRKSQNDTS